MNRRALTYAALSAIAVCSGVAVWIARNNDLLQAISAVPLAGAALGALFQILRDQAAHDRAILMQESQNRFVIGAGSHMAKVAFDKHVEFAEAYMKEAQATLVTLFRQGPTPDVLKHAWNLREIRERYLVWLTAAVEASLDPFEAAFREIGANAGYIRDMQGSTEEGEARQKALENMYNRLAQVMGMKEWRDQRVSDELAITNLTRKLREILGTEELTKLRNSILQRAFGGVGG